MKSATRIIGFLKREKQTVTMISPSHGFTPGVYPIALRKKILSVLISFAKISLTVLWQCMADVRSDEAFTSMSSCVEICQTLGSKW